MLIKLIRELSMLKIQKSDIKPKLRIDYQARSRFYKKDEITNSHHFKQLQTE